MLSAQESVQIFWIVNLYRADVGISQLRPDSVLHGLWPSHDQFVYMDAQHEPSIREPKA